ncbi:MAG: hypothetical protein IJV31_10520 [Clostridia bacterium]|nr:hypothetical protein [Clostridia bacterium]
MKYIKEELEKMLREHLKNEAKLTEIQLKKEEYQERLNYAGTVLEDEEDDVIESMQLSGQGYDNIHSNTNKISDTTSTTAMNYKKELNHINKEDREFLENKIAEFEHEENILNKKIVRVKNLLTILSKKQKVVIEEFYINNEKGNWGKVKKEYENRICKDLSIKQLQNIRDIAIKDMLEVLNM